MTSRPGERYRLLENNEKIIVTGASGFLGSWLCHHLSYRGYEVFAVIRPRETISRLGRFPKFEIFSYLESYWPSLIESIKPQVVISADWSGVDSASRNSPTIQMQNINRIKLLADASVVNNVKTFITFGSQAENGPINVPAKELNYDKATTAYGKAKIELRKILEKTFRQTQTRFVWGRIFSTYGALDNPNWFLPSLINSLINNEIFSLTSGNQKWSYLHAYDFCRSISLLIEKDTVQGVVNIGNEETVIIRNIADYIGEILDKQPFLSIGTTEYRNDQVMLLQPVTSTLNGLGWKPLINTFQGIEDLVNWYMLGQATLTIENLYQP